MARETSREKNKSFSYTEIGSTFILETDKYITFYKIIEDLGYGVTFNKLVINKYNNEYKIIKRYGSDAFGSPGHSNFIKEEDLGNFKKRRIIFTENSMYHDKMALLFLIS